MQIVRYPNDMLTTPCVPVEITEEVVAFVKEMITFMKGDTLWGQVAGLAANQVGKNWRLFVLNEEGDGSKVFINPEIVWVTKAPADINMEGCYSLVDNKFYRVERAPSVRIKWQDIDGVWHEERFNGLMAQVVQHECEHLDGRLCVSQEEIDRELESYAKFLEEHKKKMEAMNKMPTKVDVNEEGDLVEVCEFCGGSGEVQEDEYENGQIVGVGTITRKCVCQVSEPADFSGASEGDR